MLQGRPTGLFAMKVEPSLTFPCHHPRCVDVTASSIKKGGAGIQTKNIWLFLKQVWV